MTKENLFFNYARDNIPCDFGKDISGNYICKCPAASSGKEKNGSFHWVDEKRNFIFVNVPKVGSTTLRNLLFDNDHSYSLRNPKRGLNNYYKFGFVRNPWSYMVSNYIYWTTHPTRINQLSRVWSGSIETLNDFVRLTEKLANHHWHPQIDFFKNLQMDQIGKLENFQEDFNTVCDKIGIPRQKLPHRNKTKSFSKHYSSYYDDETKELVAKKYAKDIEYFGYKFGG